MKKLAAQALAFQYQLQIENAQAVLNNTNAGLNMIDQALQEVMTANEKLKMLNGMMQNVMKEVESEKKEKRS
jgi:regulator of replication initiation timing